MEVTISIPHLAGFQANPDSRHEFETTARSLVQACKRSITYGHPHITDPVNGYPVLAAVVTAVGPVIITGLPTHSGLTENIYLSANDLTRILRTFPAQFVCRGIHLGVLS